MSSRFQGYSFGLVGTCFSVVKVILRQILQPQHVWLVSFAISPCMRLDHAVTKTGKLSYACSTTCTTCTTVTFALL